MLTRFKLWIAGAVALVLAVLGAWVAGRREARQDARTEALEGDAKAHERINDADIGIGANDADNIAWLQSFHDKHKR